MDVTDARDVARRLREGGSVAADEEAETLLAAAGTEDWLERAVGRRLAGEPLAWIVGTTEFCGVTVAVDPGVYVPRWQTESLALHAIRRLPQEGGVAIDLCSGSGAIARVLREARPSARIIAVDIDPAAVSCARRNGVDAVVGDLYEPIPEALTGGVDLIVAVTPYVPTPVMALMARTLEPAAALDGGSDGLEIVRRVVAGAPHWLRNEGGTIVEIGGPQLAAARDLFEEAGFAEIEKIVDGDGDVAGLAGRCLIGA